MSVGRELRSFRGHSGGITCIAFSRDGSRFASGSADQTVRIWDVAGGESLRVLRGDSRPVADLCFSPDGRRLISSGLDSTVRIWDPETGQALLSLGRRSGLTVTLSADGRCLAVGGIAGHICVRRINPELK
jgi:WD40 repeat protein